MRIGEIVVDVRLATGREEEEPVLFDLRAGIRGVAGQLRES